MTQRNPLTNGTYTVDRDETKILGPGARLTQYTITTFSTTTYCISHYGTNKLTCYEELPSVAVAKQLLALVNAHIEREIKALAAWRKKNPKAPNLEIYICPVTSMWCIVHGMHNTITQDTLE